MELKLATSYFYQIRFFKPNMIPFSTAVWDPKWYHEFRDQSHVFQDKRGVLNGFRVEALHPGPAIQNACHGPDACAKSPPNCPFMSGYRAQLDAINCDELVRRLWQLSAAIQKNEGFAGEPVVVLIVHEPPQAVCSERGVIQQWFKSNGYECEELTYPIK